jgi:hypothetical protein
MAARTPHSLGVGLTLGHFGVGQKLGKVAPTQQ